jgi:hypothetical protein
MIEKESHKESYLNIGLFAAYYYLLITNHSLLNHIL